MTEPACILCWCHNRGDVPAVMFDGIAWYCEPHGEQVIADRLQPRWRRTLRALRRSLTDPHSPSTTPPRGRGVQIAADHDPRPRAEVVFLSPRPKFENRP